MSEVDAIGGRTPGPTRQIGRYGLFDQIAAGGMATIHLARLAGPVGFSRVVAVKHLHPHLSGDPQFKSMFIDEARMAARIRHPNVVPILDVVLSGSELFLVMEYVQGEALGSLRRAARRQRQAIPLAVCSAIMVGALQGLHAAHEARDESGQPLNLVHRDVSPPNILVGVDGVAMVLDFGVAKAMQRLHESRPGVLKGKASYMAPEQIRGEPVGRSTDTFAAAVVLWELLTGRRLFRGATEQERMYRILHGTGVSPPSMLAPIVPPDVDQVVLKGLRSDPADRYQTALEMAETLEHVIPPASQRTVGEWVAITAAETLARRAEAFKQIETTGIPQDLAFLESASVSVAPSAPGGPSPAELALGVPAAWSERHALRLMLALGAIAVGLLVGILAAGGRSRPPVPARPAAARALKPPTGPVFQPIETRAPEALPAAAPAVLRESTVASPTIARPRARPVRAARPLGGTGRAPPPPLEPQPPRPEAGDPAEPAPRRHVPLVDDPARLRILE